LKAIRAGQASPTPSSVTNNDAAVCALEALRDGKKGRFFIDRSPDNLAGYCGLLRRIQIIGDRQALVAESEYEDLGGTDSHYTAELKAPDDYQKCLDAGPSAYADCLGDAVILEGDDPACSCDACDPPCDYCAPVFSSYI
jgi:hypothetical protein